MSTSRKVAKPMWDPILEPLVNYLLKSNGVKVKPAIEVGKKAVDYFRGQCFVKWVMSNEALLRAKFPDCFNDPNSPLSPKDALFLGNNMIKGGFIYRSQHKPLTKSSEGTAEGGASTEAKVPKWPRRLAMTSTQVFDESSFYVVLYEVQNTWRYVLLGLIIGSVLVVCMFPAWPLVLKLSTWYFSVMFITIVLAISLFRLFTFLLLWFFGVDFWLLPNLFNEELGVIDSFKPGYSYVSRKDEWVMVFGRVFLAILLAAATYQLSQTHSISDVQGFATRQFLDVLDWGHQKLAAPPASSSVPSTKFANIPKQREVDVKDDPSISSTFVDEEDYSCMIPCGFESYDVLKEECIFDCKCMGEVVRSHCFKNCSPLTKKALVEAQLDSCNQEEEEKVRSAPIKQHSPAKGSTTKSPTTDSKINSSGEGVEGKKEREKEEL